MLDAINQRIICSQSNDGRMNWIRRLHVLTSLLAPTNSRRTVSTSTQKVIHLNHAGASPASDAVLRRVICHLEQEQVLGGYAAKNEVDDEVGAIYTKAARLVRASSASEIALVESATVAWTRLFYAFVAHQEQFKRTNEKIILVS